MKVRVNPTKMPMSNKRKAFWLVAIPLALLGCALFGRALVGVMQKQGMITGYDISVTNELFNFGALLATIMVIPCAIVALVYYFKKDTRVEEAAVLSSLPENQRPHPWRRYFARSIDGGIVGLAGGIPIAFFAPPEYLMQIPDTALGFVVSLLIIPFCAVCYQNWQRTPGKWIMGIAVTSNTGAPLSFEQGIRREALVFLRGVGLGIPVISLFTHIHQYNTLMKSGVVSWDKEVGCTVSYEPLSSIRVLLAILCLVGVAFVTIAAELPI